MRRQLPYLEGGCRPLQRPRCHALPAPQRKPTQSRKTSIMELTGVPSAPPRRLPGPFLICSGLPARGRGECSVLRRGATADSDGQSRSFFGLASEALARCALPLQKNRQFLAKAAPDVLYLFSINQPENAPFPSPSNPPRLPLAVIARPRREGRRDKKGPSARRGSSTS
jgi:hypothetical protein